MGSITWIQFFCVSLCITVVRSDNIGTTGEFRILHSPNSLQFLGSYKAIESILKEIISACLGLSVDENAHWRGLSVINPFNTPEAVVGVYVHGMPCLGTPHEDVKSYPLEVDEYENDIFETVTERIKDKHDSGANILMDIKLYDPEELTTLKFVKVFGECVVANVSKQQKLEHLNHTVDVDYQFLNELEALKLITMQVWSGAILPDNMVDFYNFRFRSLHDLSDIHGPNSAQTKEAYNLLDEAVRELCKAFVKAYDGSVLVTTIIINVTHARRAVRDLDPENNTQSTTTTANEGDPNLPIIFNILLWMGVAYFFALVAIVYALMDMDPGRDSIIYRMSNIKMKKEN